jgi:Calx-beta domain
MRRRGVLGTVVALGLLGLAPSGAWALSVAPVSQAEGDSGTTNFNFAIPVTATCTVSSGSATLGEDFSAPPSFPPGTCSVPVKGDTKLEQDETFTVTVTDGIGGQTATATGTILNDDPPGIAVSSPRAGEGDGKAGFTVTLTAPSTNPVTVPYATKDGSATAPADYTATSGTLTFAPGERSKVVEVPIANDKLSEGDESFTLSAGAATGTATIADDEPAVPFVGALDAAVQEGNAGTTPLTFAVVLSNPSVKPVSVEVATQNGTAQAGQDFVALAPTTVTFAPGETAKQVVVAVTGDTIAEPDETFTLVLAQPVNAAFAGSRTAALGGIFNDDGKADTTEPKARLGAPRYTKGRIAVRVTCPATETRCVGRLTLFTRSDRSSTVKALRREQRIGAADFTLAGGRSATLRVRPAKRLRPPLVRARRVKVAAFAVTRDAAGNTGATHVNGVLRTG